MQTTITRPETLDSDGTGASAPVFGRIVVAVDQFDADLSAVKLATALGLKSGAKMRVVHVREREVYAPRTFILETMDEAKDLVDRAATELRQVGLEVDGVITSAWVGKTSQAILAAADDFGADAIVIGRPRARRVFGRRTRERLLRSSSVPVLVAPRPGAGGTDRSSQGEPAARRAA